jgi:hypothetical protein
MEHAADAASTALECKAIDRYSRDYVEMQTTDRVRFAARTVKWDLDTNVSRRLAYNHYFGRR